LGRMMARSGGGDAAESNSRLGRMPGLSTRGGVIGLLSLRKGNEIELPGKKKNGGRHVGT